MTERKFSITGMSCAACSARVDKAVRGVPGVEEVQVNLLTNSMLVSLDDSASEAEICGAVEKAGYGARPMGAQGSSGAAARGSADAASFRAASQEAREALEDHETPEMMRRLAASLALLLPLLYISMGHVMWGWPVPPLLYGNPLAIALAELLLAGLVMIVNRKFFVNGFRGAVHGGANMDTLVAMGSGAGFLYSTALFFRMTAPAMAGEADAVHALFRSGLYFESSAMILTLITVGKLLEARSRGRTTDAIRGLMDMTPKEAHILRNGELVTIPASEVVSGDVFVVRPGESFPADGRVLEGESAVNEAALTGESLPVDKAAGDLVSAATINQNGALTCEAVRVGADTTLQKIIEMVSNAAATKAPIAKIADRVSGVFVPAVMLIALADFLIWMAVRGDAGFALGRAISILVISCPCALGLATPVAIMVGTGLGAKNGILFKTAASLEATGRVRYIVFDKTGTLTEGRPRVTDIVPSPGVTENDLLAAAAALEAKSEHPLAAAIRERAEQEGIAPAELSGFRALPGHGVSGLLPAAAAGISSAEHAGAVEAVGGNPALLRERGIVLDDGALKKGETLSGEGRTPLYFACGGRLLGIIAVADVIRGDSREAIQELKGMGVQPIMLTGDNARTARTIGKQLGLEAIVSDVLPDGKEAVIRQIQEYGSTAMVGDGINDSPALTRADIGMAIGAGADIAIDAADVVLMKSTAADAAGAIRLSRQVIRNIHENLFWAFFYNAICIPVAAGALIPRFGITLNPMLGAAAMSLSSFCVVTNALRLNLFKLHGGRKGPSSPALPEIPAFLRGTAGENAGRTEEKQEMKKEEIQMQKEIKVGGMMCQHCVAHVKEALEKLEGVSSAAVSLENGAAVVTLEQDVPAERLRQAVTEAGYEAGDVK